MGVVVTNALPLLGVLIWNWDLVTLLALYWLEIGVGLWWAAVSAGFAERAADYPSSALCLGAFRFRRGGLSIPGTALTWYVHNLLPVVLMIVLCGSLWTIVGLIAVDAMLEGSGRSIAETVSSVRGVGVALFVSRGWETLSRDMRTNRYRDVTSQQILQDGLWPVLVLGVLVTCFVPIAEGAGDAGSLFLLVAVIGGKFLFDLLWATYGSIRAFGEDNGGWIGGPDAADSDWEPAAADETPAFTGDPIQPRRLGVILGGITKGSDSVLGLWVGLFWTWGLFALVLGGRLVVLWWLAIAVAGLVGAGILDNTLRYWGAYRITDDGRLARCGRLFAAVHWIVSSERLASVETVSTRTDRLLGTTTILLSLERDAAEQVRTIRLPYLSDRDATAVLETLAEPDTADRVQTHPA